MPPEDAVTPDAALELMMRGNERWQRGAARHPHQSAARREQVAPGQEPFATVISCIDSRVPPELVFDCGLGDLFVVRTGAQVLDTGVVLGSVEFGPLVFPSARLIFVLGHSGCGAVQATIGAITAGNPPPGHLPAVVESLRPAYEAAAAGPGDLAASMARAQTRLTVDLLGRDPVLRGLMEQDGLMIVGGHYDLATGRVELL